MMYVEKLLSLDGIRLIITLSILGGVFFIQLCSYKFSSSLVKKMWIGSVAGVVVIMALATRVQYLAWKSGELTKLFLPPHNDWTYFARYMFDRVLVTWVISLLAAIIISKLILLLNEYREERFFEEEELPLVGLAIFLTGYPQFIFYLIAMVMVALLWTLYYTVTKKGRAPLYYLWIPVALLVIIMMYFYAPKELYAFFAF